MERHTATIICEKCGHETHVGLSELKEGMQVGCTCGRTIQVTSEMISEGYSELDDVE